MYRLLLLVVVLLAGIALPAATSFASSPSDSSTSLAPSDDGGKWKVADKDGERFTEVVNEAGTDGNCTVQNDGPGHVLVSVINGDGKVTKQIFIDPEEGKAVGFEKGDTVVVTIDMESGFEEEAQGTFEVS